MNRRAARARRGRGVAVLTIAAIALLGFAAPWLANDVPLIASLDGALVFPAFRDAFGLTVPTPPAAASWKDWWLALDPAVDADWAVMPPWPNGPFEVVAAALTPPGAAHPLGVDGIGRDLLARVLHGARNAVLVAFGSSALALLVGVPLGALAGLGGRLADRLVLRAVEVFTCFPALLAVLAIAATVGGSRPAVVLVLAAVQWPTLARVLRAELLALREQPFVAAARGVGVGPLALVRRHLAPQVVGPLAVTAAFLAAEAILIEATLTFLGLGAGYDSVSWGAMLDAGRPHAPAGAWHVVAVPALAIAITVVALHGVGDRVRLRSASAAAPA